MAHSGRSPVQRAFFRLFASNELFVNSNALKMCVPAILARLSDAFDGAIVVVVRHDWERNWLLLLSGRRTAMDHRW